MLNLIEEVLHFMTIIYMAIFQGYVGGDFNKRQRKCIAKIEKN